MANDVKWLKLMNNMFEDEKIEYIESLPDGDMILNVWIKTLCLASKCNDNGNLTITSELPYTTTLLAHKFKKTVTQIEYAFKIMQGLGMVEVNNDILCVSNWCKYQNVDELERLKEQNRLRVARCREKKKESNVTVMLQCNENALNSNSISNSITNTNNIIEETIKKKKEFIPPTLEEIKAYALERDRLDLVDKFYNYYKASEWKDNRGKKVKNWKLKFVSWENNNPKPTTSYQPKETPFKRTVNIVEN